MTVSFKLSMFPWLGFLFFTSILGAGFVGWWLPYRRTQQLTRNHQQAEIALGMFRGIQNDFRIYDSDGNGIKDFWTGDIAGFYKFNLIDRSIAEADARPIAPLVPVPIPKDGYFVVALEMDEGESPPDPLKQETDKKSGKVHNLKKWAICMYPAEPNITGKYIYIISSMHSRFRTYATRPPPRNWPNDVDLLGDAWVQWD